MGNRYKHLKLVKFSVCYACSDIYLLLLIETYELLIIIFIIMIQFNLHYVFALCVNIYIFSVTR